MIAKLQKKMENVVMKNIKDEINDDEIEILTKSIDSI